MLAVRSVTDQRRWLCWLENRLTVLLTLFRPFTGSRYKTYCNLQSRRELEADLIAICPSSMLSSAVRSQCSASADRAELRVDLDLDESLP